MTQANRKPFVGGNWKMNTDSAAALSLIDGVASGLKNDAVDVAVFPPFVYLREMSDKTSGSDMLVGAQDCWFESNGAFTGEISIEMLKDCNVKTVLTGHSERRHVIGESDQLVNKKTKAAIAGGMIAVLCVGEKLDQREAGQTDAINESQIKAGLDGVSQSDMSSVVIAYEPVWAIGTGKTATPEDAQDAHAKIRALIATMYDQSTADSTRIIYGGSMKPGNANELMAMPDIDGGLIGGASLVADDFLAIINAGQPQSV
ncbi:MAG: triose-phosphate isomerase [Phycisphaerales bacterium]|nr:triose-phosphate isomerase [Phycisphaerales bacterium]